MRAVSVVLFVVVGLVAGGARRAGAQGAIAAAQVEFDRGRALMTDGKYADACAAFERSQKLDPQIGTRYNIGICSEKQGKLTSAWIAFREVAQRDTIDGRKKDAAARAAALAPRLTKLLVNAAASPPGFVVRVNGTDSTNLLGIETPVDPGPYTVVASAPGFADWSASVSATGEGLTVTVSIPALVRPGAVEPGGPTHSEPGKATTTIDHLEQPAAPPGPPPDEASGGHRTLALGLGAGGVALLVGGVVTGAMASSRWSEAKNVCGGMTTCPDDAATAQANALAAQARTRANLSTGLVAAGVACAGAAAFLYFTAPRAAEHGLAIAPSVAPDQVAVTVGGSF